MFGSVVVEVDAAAPSTEGLGSILSKSAVLEFATEPRVRPFLTFQRSSSQRQPWAASR